MAATRLIPMHKGKGRSVAKSLSSSTDYSKNPEKTRNKELVSSYGCDPETVDEEFLLSKRQYEHKIGKKQASDVIAYQIRQSFRPGEITPEEANRIGYETAMRFTKGRYAFIVATHEDRAHIHNHVIFNSTTMDGHRKFRNFFLSSFALQRVSDLVCLEQGLSVIPWTPYRDRITKGPYRGKVSNRQLIRNDIEEILKRKPKDLDAVFAFLQTEGYEIRRGKEISVRRPGQKRFAELRSLGKGYTPESITESINGGFRNPFGYGKQKTEPVPFGYLIDIEKKISEGKNGGYISWAKRFNLKQTSKAVMFLKEHGIQDMEELQTKVETLSSEYEELRQAGRESENRLEELAQLKNHIINYAKSREIYAAYRKTGFNKDFFEENREMLTLHMAAKKAFESLGGKPIPKIREISDEYAAVLQRKKETYAALRELKTEYREMQLAQEIVKAVLVPDKETKLKEHQRTR